MYALVAVDDHSAVAIELRVIVALSDVLVDPVVLLNEGGVLGPMVWVVGMLLHLLVSVAVAVTVELPLGLVVDDLLALLHLVVATVLLEAIPVGGLLFGITQ